jgi:hypothetical protein
VLLEIGLDFWIQSRSQGRRTPDPAKQDRQATQ